MTQIEIKDRWSQEQLITGVALKNWREILKQNNWHVDREYYHRFAWITGLATLSSTFAAIENARFRQQLEEMEISPTPLFILGHWRTGTTHMHNMLGRDPNHTFSTLYQVLFPDSFLTTGRMGPKLLKNAVPDKRSYDNVVQNFFESAEDEIGLMKMTGGLSFYGAILFPDRAAEYEKYLDFLEATPAERKRFKDSLQLFIKKIMLATGGKRVVVKSCAHSARIRMILDVFPDAKFIHIHRHPARAFRSMVHMREKVDWENFMHLPKQEFVDQRWEHTATIGGRLYTRLIEDRHLIPKNNLVEIAYKDLVGNELDVLRGIYEQLEIPDWDQFERELTPYLESIQGYKVNKLQMEPELEQFVYDRWRHVYDTYGYQKEYGE
ncbi:MAG: sulfotransferase [Polyangiaceae bacterium]|nr:sulfotransferase [Polyangiaceae bacterium]